MALSEMQVFNEYILPATVETLAQQIEKFNGASGGSLTLTMGGFDGDFYQKSFFESLEAAQRRVNRYAAQATVTPADLSQLRADGVKIAGGFGLIRYEPAQLTWLRQPTAQGIEVASTNFAKVLMKDQLNTAIAALVAATMGSTSTSKTVATELNYSVINDSHALFGDSSGNLIAEVMNGAMYHKLVSQNLKNTAQLFQFDSVRIVDILGKIVVVTDAPALYDSTNSLYRVLSLVSNAAVVYDAGNLVSNIETTNGNTRIETTMQVDYDFGLALKGYSWDQTTGGKSPSDAAIATSANWDKTATDVKSTAGVIAIGA